MNNKYAELTKALEKANKAAQAYANTEDGGFYSASAQPMTLSGLIIIHGGFL